MVELDVDRDGYRDGLDVHMDMDRIAFFVSFSLCFSAFPGNWTAQGRLGRAQGRLGRALGRAQGRLGRAHGRAQGRLGRAQGRLGRAQGRLVGTQIWILDVQGSAPGGGRQSEGCNNNPGNR